MTSSSHYTTHTHTKSTITSSSLQDGGVLPPCCCCPILPTLQTKYTNIHGGTYSTPKYFHHTSPILFLKKFKFFGPFPWAPGAPAPIFEFPLSRYIPSFFQTFRPQFSLPSSGYSTSWWLLNLLMRGVKVQGGLKLSLYYSPRSCVSDWVDNNVFNTLRTETFKLFKCTFPGSKQFKSTFILFL